MFDITQMVPSHVNACNTCGNVYMLHRGMYNTQQIPGEKNIELSLHNDAAFFLTRNNERNEYEFTATVTGIQH